MPGKLKSAVVLFLMCLLWPALGVAETRSFEDPTFGRARVDYCRYERGDCGIGAAVAWCRREGFETAYSYRGPVPVEATMRVGNRTTCLGRGCNGFSQIVCERPDPVEEPVEEEDAPLAEE